MRSFLTAYVRGKKRTLKYEFAVLLLGVLVIYIVRVALSNDPAWIVAQTGVLSVIVFPILTFVSAVVGLQLWENRQPGGTVITGQLEDGEVAPEDDPQRAARGVV